MFVTERKLVEKYKNVEEFNVSVIKKHLQDNFTLRRARENEEADIEHFTCKYSRKVGFLPCPVQYKVSYMSYCDEVRLRCQNSCRFLAKLKLLVRLA